MNNRKNKIAAIAIITVIASQSMQNIFAIENEKIIQDELQPVITDKITGEINNEEEVNEEIIEEADKDLVDNEEVLSEASLEKKKITILHTNDIHGRFIKDDNVIGIDVVSTIKKQTPNSILVDAGDTIHGLPFVTLNKGQDAVDLMNIAGYEFMVPGNHDFNYGYERLKDLTIKNGEGTFRVLSSNVKKDGQSVFEPSYIKEIDGVKVGFFGISSPETSYKTNPNNIKDLSFENPIQSAKEEVEKLESQGAEVIIGLSHVGTDKSSSPTTYDVVNAVEGIDVVVDGHSHTNMPNGESVNGTLIVSTGDYMSNVGKVDIEIENKDGKNEVINAMASHITKVDTLNIQGDEHVVTKITDIKDKQDEILSKVVGKSETTLDGVRENVRTKETNLGNLITDAMLNETGSDIAITNGGGIRSSIDVGEITKEEVVEVLPFGNFIVTKELTGSQIKAILEHGVKDFGKLAGSFAHVGGIKFVVDPEKEVGKRVIEITIDNKKIDTNKKYIVATNDFLAAGGDEYPSFKDVDTLNEYSSLDEALEKYIQKLGTVNYKVEGRITTGKITSEENNNQSNNNSNESNNDNNSGNSSTNNEKNPSTGDVGIIGYATLGIAAITGLAANIFIRKRK